MKRACQGCGRSFGARSGDDGSLTLHGDAAEAKVAGRSGLRSSEGFATHCDGDGVGHWCLVVVECGVWSVECGV